MDKVKAFSTGSLSLDTAIGCGGYPRGRIVEVCGPRHSGKTTLVLQAIAEVQRGGGVATLIDAAHAWDRQIAESMGVNIAKLLVSQPDDGQQSFEIIEALIRCEAVEMIVVNSATALFPRSTGAFNGTDDVSYRSRLMNQAFNKLCVLANKHNVTLLFVRQTDGSNLESSEAKASGQVLRYYSSVRVEVQRLGEIKTGETITGHRARARVLKNKFAPPFTETVVDVCPGKGFGRSAA